MKLIGNNWRLFVASLFVSAMAVAPAAARNTDSAVRDAVAAGQSVRVIMQFATTADRDAAYNRLLDAGAAVRAAQTEVGPVLVALGNAALLSTEFSNATQVSLDAGVHVLSSQARSTSAWRANIDRAVAARQVLRPRSGLSVAVIDSGVAPSVDLPRSRIRAYVDFVSGGTTPIDKCGHGTHVAGI
ncbi:MAG TPA: hypothetical protein VNT81_01585, partial [Vicinamibacterales bacterium]|nr:hypothetical protein [Vicinamibacterales bacterium]